MASPDCRYCDAIHRYDRRYQVRPARHALRSSHPRCDLHWRFTCAVCGSARHFNGVAFCPRADKLFCLDCAPEHRAPRSPFWRWSYFYRMRCPWHQEWHPALDRAEYEDRHPWTVRPRRAIETWGMALSESIPDRWTLSLAPLAGLTDRAIRVGWNRLAPWWVERYTARGDINREWITDPVLLRFLGPVRGQRVLDAGCGSGYLARILARRGARVDGVDQSDELLAVAQADEEHSPLGIRYGRANLARLPFPSGTFDATVANFVLQDVRQLRESVREIHRTLRPGGRFAFTTTHPAFEAPAPARWVREPRDSERIEDRRYLRVDRYFDRVVVYWGPPGLEPAPGFHRPLRDFFGALSEAGFLVARFEEPTPSRRALEAHFREFADLDRIPIFVVVLAIKPVHGTVRKTSRVAESAARPGERRRPPRRHRR